MTESRENEVKVRLTDDELPRLDGLRPRSTSRAAYVRSSVGPVPSSLVLSLKIAMPNAFQAMPPEAPAPPVADRDLHQEAASVRQALMDINRRAGAAFMRAAEPALARPDARLARAQSARARMKLNAELGALAVELDSLCREHPWAKGACSGVLDGWMTKREWLDGIAARTIEYLELPRRQSRRLTANQVADWVVSNRAPEFARARARESHGAPTRRRGSRRRTNSSGSTSSGEDSDPEPPAPAPGAEWQDLGGKTSESVAAGQPTGRPTT